MLWSKVAGCHAVLVWHVVQSVGNPACGGAAAFVKSVWWQPMHVVESPTYWLLMWHCAHVNAACAPASGNDDVW